MIKTKAFTLIEILVVATIIVLLTSGAIATYQQLSKSSRDAKRKSDLEQIRAGLEMYRSNNDIYPNALLDLTAPTVYIQSIPSDPKSGYTYVYTSLSSDYTIGAYLESGGTGNCGSCGTTNCNYCLGPYGEK